MARSTKAGGYIDLLPRNNMSPHEAWNIRMVVREEVPESLSLYSAFGRTNITLPMKSNHWQIVKMKSALPFKLVAGEKGSKWEDFGYSERIVPARLSLPSRPMVRSFRSGIVGHLSGQQSLPQQRAIL
ncbi:hypothetical protein [Ignatzschineria indica]|uniref:hypothetical protein n=1 Tax=Ignatzschineria indica TaxID=472583 RepID=UPI00363A5B06